MTPPAEAAPEDLVVAFVYDTAKYGRVVVEEDVPSVLGEAYDTANEEVVATAAHPGVSGSAEMTIVRSGHKALVTTAEDRSRSTIVWLEDGVEIIVRGPSLSSADCIAIAEAL